MSPPRPRLPHHHALLTARHDRIVLCAVALSMALAACGDDSSTETPPQDAAAPTPDAAPSPPPDASPSPPQDAAPPTLPPPDAAPAMLRFTAPGASVQLFLPQRVEWVASPTDTTYDIRLVDADTDEVLAAESGLAENGWLPPRSVAGRRARLEVTAQPSGASGTLDFAVRVLAAEPDLVAPQTICGDAEGIGSRIAYGLAVLGGKVFTGWNADAAGVCRSDAATLAHEGVFGNDRPTFRTFGVTKDAANDRIYAAAFPFLVQCDDPLDRVLVLDAPTSAEPRVSRLETGMESPYAMTLARGTLHQSALFTQSCYGANLICSDDGSCPNGFSSYLAYEVEAEREVVNDPGNWGTAAITADADRVYRGTMMQHAVYVHDASTGALLATTPLEGPGEARGLLRLDDGPHRFLVETSNDNHLRVYALEGEGFMLLQDLVLSDSYWQGDFDGEHFYWPAQNTRRVVRHGLKP